MSTTLTCSAASFETKYSETLEGQAIGSSSCQISSRQRFEEIVHADDDFVMIGADCLRDFGGIAQFAELRFGVADGKVLTGPSAMRLISAAMALESTPPLRNIPSGTSLIRRMRTVSSRRRRVSAIHSWSVRQATFWRFSLG